MDNNKFWQEYKAKCLEKGLDAGTFEEFEQRQTPPQAFSADRLVEKKKAEPNAGVFKEIVPLKRGVERPPKNKLKGEFVGEDALLLTKEVPLLKEPKEKMVSMSEAVFHEIIIMAYERGVMQAQMHLGTLIVEADLPVILDDILGGTHVQSVA